ncbi:unnamed protein product [Bursaphelenchus okinawaensis]|uniref:Peptidase A1 domain-containing protein n=1 Tax=Bursaphelenchus okinawaensis TaxID=465554 RepID=A0A811L0C9_9BILA|nr:unnamed protein product [Bursaphelenchus okinawaensis]CAG9114456.1 unnamed protein product [Bursaphelenchus okinawaensis]
MNLIVSFLLLTTFVFAKKFTLPILEKTQNLANSRVPVYDYLEAEYLVTLSIGTPPQKFRVLVDNSSPITWVPGSDCVYDGKEDVTKKKFSSKNSSTYQPEYDFFGHNTTLGKVAGKLATDTVTLGEGENSLTLEDIEFGIASVLGIKYNNYALDGVLGLGRQPNSFIQRAINASLLDEPLVSIHFKDEGFDKTGKLGGALTLGGVDNANCGIVSNWVDMEHEFEWIFNVSSINLDGFHLKGGLAQSNTGIGFVFGPFEWIYSWARGLGADYATNRDIWISGCEIDFLMQFTIGKQNYTVSPKNLIQYMGPHQWCQLQVKSTDFLAPYQWILGAPFVQGYCHVYDFENGRLGFAPLIKI